MLLAAHPFLMKAWSLGHRDAAGRWLGRIAGWYITAGALATAGVWLLGPELAAVFLGADFRAGSVILAPVVAGLVLWQLGMYTHKPMEFAGRTGQMFAVALAVASLKVVLNVMLLPAYGYQAAAWTTMGCFALYVAITWIIGQSTVRWRPDVRRILLMVVPLLLAGWFARPLPTAARAALLAVMGVAVLWHEWRTLRSAPQDT
jgi:O-antigen/teichoic acid export membrane protein